MKNHIKIRKKFILSISIFIYNFTFSNSVLEKNQTFYNNQNDNKSIKKKNKLIDIFNTLKNNKYILFGIPIGLIATIGFSSINKSRKNTSIKTNSILLNNSQEDLNTAQAQSNKSSNTIPIIPQSNKSSNPIPIINNDQINSSNITSEYLNSLNDNKAKGIDIDLINEDLLINSLTFITKLSTDQLDDITDNQLKKFNEAALESIDKKELLKSTILWRLSADQLNILTQDQVNEFKETSLRMIMDDRLSKATKLISKLSSTQLDLLTWEEIEKFSEESLQVINPEILANATQFISKLSPKQLAMLTEDQIKQFNTETLNCISSKLFHPISFDLNKKKIIILKFSWEQLDKFNEFNFPRTKDILQYINPIELVKAKKFIKFFSSQELNMLTQEQVNHFDEATLNIIDTDKLKDATNFIFNLSADQLNMLTENQIEMLTEESLAVINSEILANAIKFISKLSQAKGPHIYYYENQLDRLTTDQVNKFNQESLNAIKPITLINAHRFISKLSGEKINMLTKEQIQKIDIFSFLIDIQINITEFFQAKNFIFNLSSTQLERLLTPSDYTETNGQLIITIKDFDKERLNLINPDELGKATRFIKQLAFWQLNDLDPEYVKHFNQESLRSIRFIGLKQKFIDNLSVDQLDMLYFEQIEYLYIRIGSEKINQTTIFKNSLSQSRQNMIATEIEKLKQQKK